MSSLPSSTDTSPLVEKIRGQGGMISRHLTRLAQEVFDAAHVKMENTFNLPMWTDTFFYLRYDDSIH